MSVVISPSATWTSKELIPNLVKLLKEVIEALIAYATLWKQPINFNKTLWMLFHRQVAPLIPQITCSGNEISHVTSTKYLGTYLDCKLSFTKHICHIESKIYKNLSIFKRISAGRILTEEVAYKLYNAYIRPYYQSLLNIFPMLSVTKREKLEALNRKIHRYIHGWHDARNIEINQLTKFKTIDELSQHHWDKLISTIHLTNPNIIRDFLQFKLYLLYLNEYYKNSSLLKEKRRIVQRGRTNKKIINLLNGPKYTLLDFIICFE